MSSWKDPFGSKYPRDKEEAKRQMEQRKGKCPGPSVNCNYNCAHC